MVNISIHTSFIKLDQFLKFAGVTENGGQAKHLIQEGKVSVNGAVALERGKKLHPGDVVLIFGKQYAVVLEKEKA